MYGKLRYLILISLLLIVASCTKTKDIEKRIDSLIKAKDYENALSLINEKIKEEPSNKRYRFLKIKIHSRSGNADLAYDEFQRYYSLTGKIDREILKELIISTQTSFIAPYKFSSLINLAELNKLEPEFRKNLTDALMDRDDTVKVGALWAVGKLKIKEAEDRVIELVKHKNPGVVFNSLWALGELKSEKGKSALLDFIKNPKDETFIPEAIIALGKIGDKSILPDLKKYTNSTNKRVSVSSLTVTEFLEKAKVTDVYNYYLSRKDDEALSFLYLIAGELKIKDFGTLLTNQLKTKNSASRERVIRAIAELNEKISPDLLKNFLKSEDNGERTQSYYALYKLGAKDKQAFLEGIKDKLPEVRRFSFLGLGMINDKESKELLISKMLSTNIYDKIAITYALYLND
ncbi:MAG: HEAT repeat domain-containing protein [Proteobacteria bacterium]|nr:HEAT repeat domain-containing protein [Pseudomonadota bacterium]